MFVRKSLRQAVLVLATAAIVLAACSGGAAPEPTVDVNAINTAAVATAMGQLSAQFTQTALAAPTNTTLPTNTALPLPTFALPTAGAGSPAPTTSGALPTVSFNTTPTTPLPGFTALASPVAPAATTSLGDACNNSAFEADVTIEDGSVLEPGQNFVKTWRIRNTGTCTWDEGYELVYIGGSNPNLDPYDLEFDSADDFVTGGETADLSVQLTTPCDPGEYEGHWRMRNDQGAYFGTVVSVYVKVTDDC
ncbi:MAG TPA: NBR1-Ig-like domain-containing protein [Anaerolineales bacterium]|nr:NBR1-Ig-like domain-containing protein [Anaerolineales bacterium]